MTVELDADHMAITRDPAWTEDEVDIILHHDAPWHIRKGWIGTMGMNGLGCHYLVTGTCLRRRGRKVTMRGSVTATVI